MKKQYKIENISGSNLYKIEVYLTKEIGYATIPSKNEYKPYAYIMAFDEAAIKNLGIESNKENYK